MRDGEGEKWVVGGTAVRGLATRKETEGRFSIYEVLGSNLHKGKGWTQALEFKDTHHAVYTVEGVVKLMIDGN